MRELLKSYLKRLTNLTANNRSILLLRLPALQFVDITEFAFLADSTPFNIIESLIANKKTTLCPEMDSRDEAVNLMSRRLKKLHRYDQFILEERGSKDLYVGWPFVRGKLADGTLIRCPLLFFPVEMELQKSEWQLKPRTDAGITLNKSFLLAYAHFNKVKIDDDFLDRGFEDFDADSTVFRTALYQLFKESPIEIHFNQDNFIDTLIAFKTYKKQEFEGDHQNGMLKLFPEAVLGIFPQAGSHLVPDYTHLIENNNVQDLEGFFAQRSADPDAPPSVISEEKTFTPFKMDAFQENALKAIKRGNSIVVQGPPGTGKSQLICNLISDHIAIGKKVLVVCQKRAALDVVYARMHEKDMTDFLGLIHDFRNDRKTIYTKIARQIDRLEEYQSKNNGLDAIQLERNFLQISRRIDQLAEEMEEFKFALFDERECNLSVKELYLTSDIDAPTINLKQEYTRFTFDKLPDFLVKLRQYMDYAARFVGISYPWNNRKSFETLGVSDQKHITELLDTIPQYQQEVAEKTTVVTGTPLSLEDCDAVLEKYDYVKEMLGILKHKQPYNYFQKMMQYPDGETSSLWLSNTERVLMECYKGVGPETSLPVVQLGKFQEVLQRRMDARKSLLRLLQWRLFSKDKYLIRRVLVANGLKRNREGFYTLVEKIDNRLNLEHNITKLRQKEWLTDIPGSYEKVAFQNWFHVQKQAVKAKLIFNGIRNFSAYFNVQKLTYAALKERLEVLHKIVKDVPRKKTEWQKYFTSAQLKAMATHPEQTARLKQTLRKDFDALCEFDRLKGQLEAHETQAIAALTDHMEELNSEHAESLFQNSLRLAWIEHIEMKYPILRAVSSMKIQKDVAELQNKVREKLLVSNDMLLLRARERIYENVTYNRLNNRVTYRDLYHQVTKKKRVWPLRKLVTNYYDELFNLIPCWMASPESVSAVFPMTEMFDLVIFDEASQCFTERGIPAMYRGRQVVIAGDDKQLRPNDLYQARYEDDTDEDPALEVDSLLELAGQHLMNVSLKGHYRSKSLDLIDFSNQHFYGGSLKLLPDFDVINKKEPAIDYITVNGVWENNINDKEAVKVVSLLTDILRHSPEKQVGVVTFNAKQQQHILDTIDTSFAHEGLTMPTSWFVKNIENVQGDEKDVIIFSTAYAPDSKGKMAMQFGSLNAVYGENRLNVAITRAREKIIIVSSIKPQQLKVESSKNEGPKLLRAYLEYAWNVAKGNYVPTPYPETHHNPHWYLKNKLIAWAKQHMKDVDFAEALPFADLTITQNDHYLGLVITDDEHYYQSESVKDLHVYTPFTLSKKGWQFKGIYSREFWHNKEQLQEAMQRFVAQCENKE